MNMIPKAQATRTELNNRDYIKLKGFFMANKTTE